MDNKKNQTPETQNNVSVETKKASEVKVQESKVKIISPGRMVAKRFFRSRLSVIGLGMLIFLFVFSFIFPLFSALPFIWGESEGDNTPGEPILLQIESIYFQRVDTEENIIKLLKSMLDGKKGKTDDIIIKPSDINNKNYSTYLPFLYREYGDTAGLYGTYENDSGKHHFTVKKQSAEYIILLGVIENDKLVVTESRIVQYSENQPDRNINGKISRNHWLGTDSNAYDILSRLMYGGRISLTVGFVSVAIALFLGLLFGGLAGYFGKWVDNLIMRIVDIIGCLPGLPITFIFSAIVSTVDMPDGLRIYIVMALFSLIGWGGIARFARGQILTLREQEFMVAAEALGLPVSRRIIKHLIPNIMPLLIVSAVTALGGAILTEASLSYFGMGVRAPKASWGAMISAARDPTILTNYPTQWIPAGVVTAMAVLAFGILGDGLRDAFDPKSKR